MDDIGASTKKFERYCRNRFLNFGFLRDRRFFGRWGPYREMNEGEWHSIFSILQAERAKLTVGVTAAWVESSGTLTPFPEKFPLEMNALRRGVALGVVEIANHGLTHCVLEGKRFKPRLWGSNRKFHREFWDWIPALTQYERLSEAQRILESAFEIKVTTFIPPGNVYSADTLQACQRLGLKVLNCYDPKIFLESSGGVRVIGDENVIAFHDREIVLEGTQWLRNLIRTLPETDFCFVRDL